jgi:hypothetical protein
MSGATRVAKSTAIAGTVLMIVSGVVETVLFVVAAGRSPKPDDFAGGHWNTTYMEKHLAAQFSVVGGEVLVSVLSILAFLCMAHVFWILKRLYASERNRSYASAGLYLFVLGLAFQYINFLQILGAQLGGRTMFEQLEKDDNSGLKSLIVTMGVVLSQGQLLGAFELIMVSVAVGLFTYFSYWGDGPEEVCLPVCSFSLFPFLFCASLSVCRCLLAPLRE